ncbi:MAG: nitroreductase family protein [Candidatus Aenigmatarchaeota archaeon]
MPFRTLAKFPMRKKKVELGKGRTTTWDVVFENIKSRVSVRSYKKADVPDDMIEDILIAASYAPSAGNHQPWEFVVVKDEKIRQQITHSAFDQGWMMSAPVFIVACINMRIAKASYGERGEKLFCIQDVANATENLLLAANALGLGTCWVGSFSEPMVSLAIKCPDYVRPCAIITVGWPAEVPEAQPRHTLHEFVHEEIFGETEREKAIRGRKIPHY